MIPLRGRLIAELNPGSHTRKSGLVVINDKEIAKKATVLSVGADSVSVKGKKLVPPAKVGDVIHFREYKALGHGAGVDALKQGKVTIWWEDIILVETND